MNRTLPEYLTLDWLLETLMPPYRPRPSLVIEFDDPVYMEVTGIWIGGVKQ